jgi:hypothetical protein
MVLVSFPCSRDTVGAVVCHGSCSDGRDKDDLTAVMAAVPTSTVLYMWAASVEYGNRPDVMTEVVLTEALRTPPAITREVQQAAYIRKSRAVPDYSPVASPLACDGRAVQFVHHSGPGHRRWDPVDCEACGSQVAERLTSLHVGVTGQLFCLFVCLSFHHICLFFLH